MREMSEEDWRALVREMAVFYTVCVIAIGAAAFGLGYIVGAWA